MMKKPWTIVAGFAFLLVGLATGLYVTNATPHVPAVSPAEAARPTKPYVVKLHAQWCPICMMTKGVWASVQDTYAGRVNLVVFDFTNTDTTQRSQTEARRLGLESFFDEFSGVTGTVVVLDGSSKQVKSSIQGSRDFAQYRAAIDRALANAER